uniref:Fungal N-terminal domain-containing protein n=1 Tax=Bionectria ochroleuca TaxID=29856 RepID=A0A0B7K6E0_BIOOC
MLVGDIQSTLLVLIKLGVELKARLDALNQAAEDVQLLTTNLRLLLIVFENPANESILKGHVSEFVSILDILESIAKSCAKCAQVLDLDPSGQTAAEGSREAFGRKLIRRICVVKRIPGLLTEIQCKAEQLQKIYSAVLVVILQDIRTNQEQPPTGVGSSTLMTQHEASGLDFSTNFASIDIILGNLMDECKSLRQQLEDSIIHPDTSAIEHYEKTNPEGMAFWKSSFRYEMLYVSWARFVREIESSFVLNNIPTGVWDTSTVDLIRALGHRYHIDQYGTRRLSTIRPLWLPALQSILDPLHKEFKACFGGRYSITAGAGANTYVFSTTPIKASFDGMLQNDVHSDAPTPQLEFILLGPSKVFYQAPKIGEKIQACPLLDPVEYDGLWYDSRVTLVDEDEIEFVDWDQIAPRAGPDTPIEDSKSDSSDEYGGLFSEQMLETLEKAPEDYGDHGRETLPRDSVNAPVMYPDFRFRYYKAEISQLYLPARIVDVQGDQYVVEFSPAVCAYAWWPGRLGKGTSIELIPGSSIHADNPYELNRATLAMNLVRPLSTGPRPVLGMQSGKPPRWSSFQGVQLGKLEELLEQSLWNDGGRSSRDM